MSQPVSQTLHEADGLLSLVAARYSSRLPDDLRVELLEASRHCRAAAPLVQDLTAAFDAQDGTMREDFPWLHEALAAIKKGRS